MINMNKTCWQATGNVALCFIYIYTMDGQKVPGMMILHCNGRTYGNAYLITLKARPLRPHTHLLHRSCHGWKHRRKASFLIFPEFGCHIRFDVFHGCETCPLEAQFQSRKQPQVTRSEIRRVRWLGDETASDVWLGALSWCRNHCPCLPLVAPLPLQNLHVVTLCPGGTTLWCTKPSMS
jgi:hypothetical protein